MAYPFGFGYMGLPPARNMRRRAGSFGGPNMAAHPPGPSADGGAETRVNSMKMQRELYAALAMEKAGVALCSDNIGGLRSFRVATRDPFWPSFAHPRWLDCDSLYCGR